MSDIVLQAENLFYQYPTRSDYALRDICISIKRGEFVALIGQNGSGKTTLVKHFNGLLKPTAGGMIVEGRETTDLLTSELAKSVGNRRSIKCSKIYMKQKQPFKSLLKRTIIVQPILTMNPSSSVK